MSDLNDQSPRSGDITPLSDSLLLRRFVTETDQQAFGELVRRHSGWVLSTARRRCGAAELAQEAAQNVFLALARKAPRLLALPGLAPWLHRAAVLETAALLRRESRYRQAMKRHQDESTPQETAAAEEAWHALRDHVDEALNSLRDIDRDLLILHHVEGQTFPEIARKLGSSEAAAQRRGHRALEKLAARLRRCGIKVSASALGAVMFSGMRAEAAQSEFAADSLLRAVKEAAKTAIPSGLPAWAVSPAMLAVVGLMSAGLPVWLGSASQARSGPSAAPPPTAAAPASVRIESPAGSISGIVPASLTANARLTFLRQALEQIQKPPQPEGPTELGLRLRKYMLALPEEELAPVGQLLKETTGDGGELPAIVEAFNDRLARLNPQLALDLLRQERDKNGNGGPEIKISRTALLDVLSRGDSLPELVKICEGDDGLQIPLISQWASHDPLAAMEYTERIMLAEPESDKRAIYLGTWLFYDPPQAVKWLDANAEAKAAIYDRASTIFPGGVGDWAVRQVPPGEAVEMTLSLHDPLVRNSFLSAMHGAYGGTQPEILADLAPLMQLEPGAKPLSVAGFLKTWRKKDEQAAAAWVQQLPEGNLRTAASEALAQPLPPKP